MVRTGATGSAAGVSCGRAGGELIGDPAATPFCCGVDMGEGALFTLAAALFMTRVKSLDTSEEGIVVVRLL
jgi:hypothetical protein